MHCTLWNQSHTPLGWRWSLQYPLFFFVCTLVIQPIRDVMWSLIAHVDSTLWSWLRSRDAHDSVRAGWSNSWLSISDFSTMGHVFPIVDHQWNGATQLWIRWDDSAPWQLSSDDFVEPVSPSWHHVPNRPQPDQFQTQTESILINHAKHLASVYWTSS